MTLGLVMIVKDEEARIERCLQSAIWAGVRVATIIDTGSTDGTLDILARPTWGIDLRVRQEPFVNFGQARSLAFAAARGSADWLLALDADMTVEIDGFEPNEINDAYMVRMGSGEPEWWLPLVLRGDLPWESRGAVHEYTTLPDRGYVSARTEAVRITSGQYADASADKLRWHLGLLKAELEAKPDDPRTTFYLAQTYRDLGNAEKAVELYGRRAVMDNGEEAFCAAYQVACLTDDWPGKQAALMTAWHMRPSRAEPLYDLLHGLNQRGQHRAAYWLSMGAGEPPSDVLFLYPAVWDWGIAFERSIAAWHVGDMAEHNRLAEQLMANPNLPDAVRVAVMRNRSLVA